MRLCFLLPHRPKDAHSGPECERKICHLKTSAIVMDSTSCGQIRDPRPDDIEERDADNNGGRSRSLFHKPSVLQARTPWMLNCVLYAIESNNNNETRIIMNFCWSLRYPSPIVCEICGSEMFTLWHLQLNKQNLFATISYLKFRTTN